MTGLFGSLFFHYFKFFFLRFDVRIFLNTRGTDKMGRDKNNRELIVGERVFLDPAEATHMIPIYSHQHLTNTFKQLHIFGKNIRESKYHA